MVSEHRANLDEALAALSVEKLESAARIGVLLAKLDRQWKAYMKTRKELELEEQKRFLKSGHSQ